jgi:hypothetical protein
MKIHFPVISSLFALLCALAFASWVSAESPSNPMDAASNRNDGSAATRVAHLTDADSMRIAGEQRFRANCGRCHAAPQKFPSRMMGTILRHMRVRATITAEDQGLILFYMTQ